MGYNNTVSTQVINSGPESQLKAMLFSLFILPFPSRKNNQ